MTSKWERLDAHHRGGEAMSVKRCELSEKGNEVLRDYRITFLGQKKMVIWDANYYNPWHSDDEYKTKKVTLSNRGADEVWHFKYLASPVEIMEHVFGDGHAVKYLQEILDDFNKEINGEGE